MTEHPHAHIVAQHRAAAHDAERDWDGYDPTEDYTPGDEEPMTVQPADCGGCCACLGCAIRARWGG